MQTVSRIGETPFRPRHFRPLPAGAPAVADERHAAALETCRARLVMVACVFAVVFLVVALRLLTMPLLLGGSGDSAARVRPIGPPPPARADIVDRNGQLLATTLTPRRFMPIRAIFPTRARRQGRSCRFCRSSTQAEIYAKLTSGKSFVFIKRRLTPTPAI